MFSIANNHLMTLYSITLLLIGTHLKSTDTFCFPRSVHLWWRNTHIKEVPPLPKRSQIDQTFSIIIILIEILRYIYSHIRHVHCTSTFYTTVNENWFQLSSYDVLRFPATCTIWLIKVQPLVKCLLFRLFANKNH